VLFVLNQFRAATRGLASFAINKQGEAVMLNTKLLCGLALVIPLLGAAIPAEAAKAKVDATAARQACFEQAQAAASAAGVSAPTGAKNTAGVSAYHACAKKAGIKP
jgi:hypothetical protein